MEYGLYAGIGLEIVNMIDVYMFGISELVYIGNIVLITHHKH